MKASHMFSPVFDDANLVGTAGLLPGLLLGESAGLSGLLGEHLSVSSPNSVVKSTGVIAGMLTGVDSIDDLNVLRHGGMPRMFTGIRAPSTLGTFLRSFTHGHVKQLEAVNTRLLAGLTGRVHDRQGCREDAVRPASLPDHPDPYPAAQIRSPLADRHMGLTRANCQPGRRRLAELESKLGFGGP